MDSKLTGISLKLLIIVINIANLFDCQNFSPSVKGFNRHRDIETQRKCISWDESNKCGEMMIYYKHPLAGCENLGFCDCDQGFRNDESCSDHPIRMKLYVPDKRRCYPVFAQGPCRPRDWLVMDETVSAPKCVRNRCFPRGFNTNSSSNQYWFFDPTRKRCYQTLTKGYCSAGMTLELTHDSQYPTCKLRKCPTSHLANFRSPLSCRAGTRYSSLLGTCRSSRYLSSFRNSANIG